MYGRGGAATEGDTMSGEHERARRRQPVTSMDDNTIAYYNQNAAAFVRDTVGALLEPMLAP